MSENSNSDKKQWKETIGLPADKTVAQVVCSEKHKEEWKTEADENGYPSMSKYLYELIQEARAYRNEGYLAHHESEEQITELQEEVDRLERKLEAEQKRQAGDVMIDDPAFVRQFLSDNYQPLTDILQDIVESGALDGILRKRVEEQLYFLASQDEVAHERGWGWKLVGNGGDA